jgi:hypothetical protein
VAIGGGFWRKISMIGCWIMPKQPNYFPVPGTFIVDLAPQVTQLMRAIGIEDYAFDPDRSSRFFRNYSASKDGIDFIVLYDRDITSIGTGSAAELISGVAICYQHRDGTFSRRRVNANKNGQINLDKIEAHASDLQVLKQFDDESCQRQQSQQEADRLAYEKFAAECQAVGLSDAWRLNPINGTVGIFLDGLSIDQAVSVRKLIDSDFAAFWL